MRPCRFLVSALLLFLASAAAAPAGVLDGNCRVANQPAATLLIPYFEVDLDDPAGQTTLLSVNNASVRPIVARVVLWTDWGVPTLAFDVYLTGYDVQTLNLRDLLQGTLPATGPEVMPAGPLSDDNVLFTGCGNTGTAGITAQPDAAQISWLRSAHTGQPVVTTPAQKCAGSGGRGLHVATGYVTVDAVNRCSASTVGSTVNTPAHSAYFVKGGSGLASDANVLWGDYHYINSHHNTSDSQTAIPIVADPDFFHAGDYTFYGRYVGFDGRDDRIPLSSLYYARYLNGGPFTGGTELIVWRDNRTAAVATGACGTAPSWAPLGEMQMVMFDESENPTEIIGGNAFPLATQKVQVGDSAVPVPEPFGFIMIDLWHGDSTHAQGWVSVIMSAEGRFSTGYEAVRVDDLCNFGV